MPAAPAGRLPLLPRRHKYKVLLVLLPAIDWIGPGGGVGAGFHGAGAGGRSVGVR